MKKYIYLIIAGLFITTTGFSQKNRDKQPAPGPAPVVNLAEPETFKLDNGLTVMIVENHKLPRVRYQLFIDNPPHASGAKAGVETLFSAMIGNGTTSIPKDEFNEEVDFMGASISFGDQRANAQALTEYAPRVLEMMADAIKNPLLTETEFVKEKDKFLELIKSQERDVSAVSRRMRNALIFGKNHPKGEFATAETVGNLELRDVKNYYSDYMNPKNAYLVVVGDVKRRDIEPQIRKNFEDWKAKTVPSVSFQDPKDVQYTQVNFIDMPNAVQSEIGVAHLMKLKMSDADYFPLLIANHILGGGFNSMLNMNLREKHGWTYGARSQTGADKYITNFIATTSVRNAVTDSAVVEMLNEIRNIREVKISTQQLNNAKAKYTGDFVLAMERPETIANYALRIKTQNLADDFYLNFLKKINAVTVDDIQRVAKKYYKSDNLRIVVVGKGADVLEGLKNLKGPKGKAIPVQYFDRYGNAVKEPDYNKTVDVSGQQILDAYLNALGGKKALEAVKTLEMKASATMQGMAIDLKTIQTSKGQTVMEISMGGMILQKMVFDGEKGYSVTQGQRTENDDETNALAKKQSHPFPELSIKDPSVVRMDEVDGKEVYVVKLSEDQEAYYDKATGLKLKQDTTGEAMGQTITTSSFFGDYKTVEGIKFPHELKQSAGPQEINFKINEININKTVSDDMFK